MLLPFAWKGTPSNLRSGFRSLEALVSEYLDFDCNPSRGRLTIVTRQPILDDEISGIDRDNRGDFVAVEGLLRVLSEHRQHLLQLLDWLVVDELSLNIVSELEVSRNQENLQRVLDFFIQGLNSRVFSKLSLRTYFLRVLIGFQIVPRYFSITFWCSSLISYFCSKAK